MKHNNSDRDDNEGSELSSLASTRNTQSAREVGSASFYQKRQISGAHSELGIFLFSDVLSWCSINVNRPQCASLSEFERIRLHGGTVNGSHLNPQDRVKNKRCQSGNSKIDLAIHNNFMVSDSFLLTCNRVDSINWIGLRVRKTRGGEQSGG